MKGKVQGLIAVIVLAAGLTGCFSVDIAASPVLGPQVEEHVVVCNYGWNLFGCLPLVCGNENRDSWCPFTFFKDEVSLDLAYAQVAARAKRTGCKVSDLVVNDDRCVMFDCFYVVVPWVIQYKEVNLSALLVRDGEAME